MNEGVVVTGATFRVFNADAALDADGDESLTPNDAAVLLTESSDGENAAQVLRRLVGISEG